MSTAADKKLPRALHKRDRDQEHPHAIRLLGELDGARIYACACGVIGRFGELTDEDHEAVRGRHRAKEAT